MSTPGSPSDKDRLLDHGYDGIQEYDNPMPRWWVYIFWVTIVFSVVYVINVGPVGNGRGRVADYERDMAAFKIAHPEPSGPADATKLAALAKDPAALSLGKQTFAQNCAA